MNRLLSTQISVTLKLLLLGFALPLLLHRPVWGQERCSETEIRQNIAQFENLAEENPLRSPAFRSVVRCSSKSIQPLIRVIQDKNSEANIRRGAVWALGRVGSKSPEVVNLLVTLIRDRYKHPWFVRSSAIAALEIMQVESQTVIDSVIDVIKDKGDDAGVRMNAAGSLRFIESGVPEVREALIAVLRDQTDYVDVRSNAARSLGSIKSESAEATEKTIDALIAVIQDKNKDKDLDLHLKDLDLRWTALDTLSSIGLGSTKTLETFIKIVEDLNAELELRLRSVRALGDIGLRSTDAIKIRIADVLIAVVKDKFNLRDLRVAAAEALGQMKAEFPKVVNDLIAVFKNPNTLSGEDSSAVCSAATHALGVMGIESREAVNLLMVVVKDSEKSLVTRSGAIFALGQVEVASKQVEAVDTLLSTLKNSPEIRNQAFQSLSQLGLKLEQTERRKQLSTEELKHFLDVFEEAWKTATADREMKIMLGDRPYKDVIITQEILQQEYNSRLRFIWADKILKGTLIGFLGHLLLWTNLIAFYPKSSWIQAIFFWNPKVRKWAGFWYVDFALNWIPFLRSRLFFPFRESLLADAHLDTFDPNAYFPNSHVKPKQGNTNSKPIAEVILEIQGQLILEGESGLGKSIFLRDLARKSQRIVVYLPAKKCDRGVLEAIKHKLHGQVKEDPNFLRNLIYSGAMDICIDGLNEVTPDTRATITHFVESYFKGNIIMATQPIEWTPPSTAKTYILQPLQDNQIEEFLCSRVAILTQDAPLQGIEYEQACQDYLTKTLAQKPSDEEQIAIRRMLSNPMELTVVAQMLAEKKTPNLLKLQEEQYEMMAADYDKLYPVKQFPLKAFSEVVYQMRLNNEYTIPPDDWQAELQCMERYKMVISRQIKQEDKTETEWYFRHDKIQDFFIVQTFLEPENENRLLDCISDSRFRGVYFLLVIMMPFDAAQQLREDLIQYAANTKDHTVSDTFIQLFRNRQASHV